MRTFITKLIICVPFLASILLTACNHCGNTLPICGGGGGGGGGSGGSGGSGGTPAASDYTIGGTISGLSGSLELQDNSADNLTVLASSAFTFPTSVPKGGTYSVTVLTQPPGQTCTVSAGSGTTTANTASIAVNCSNNGGTLPPSPILSWFVGSQIGIGNVDGIGTAAKFFGPDGLVADSLGNIYVADSFNNLIRKITPAGVVTTFAGTANLKGSGDGTGTAATFNYPTGIAIDSTGTLFVVDSNNDTIRKITPAGAVSTFAGTAGIVGGLDGVGSAARFNYPYGIAIDNLDTIYISDMANNMIRKITPAGTVTTLAGSTGTGGSIDATGAAASFNTPLGLTTDSTGNVFVVDKGNSTIREISPAGVVTTFAGTALVMGSTDATGAAASFHFPHAITIDPATGNFYVTDANNYLIRKITPAAVVTTVAGTLGQGTFIAGTLPGSLMPPGDIAISGQFLLISNGYGIVVINPLP
jgi:hypothetical protein